jgi:hypothetical protein
VEITFSLILLEGRKQVAISRQDPVTLRRLRLEDIQSFRNPTSYRGQKHLPGYFWLSQTLQLIWYESRLEMMILKTLDFEEKIKCIISQPINIEFTLAGKTYNHVPDFLLIRKDGSKFLLNVKPLRFINSAKNERAFAACADLCKELNWDYATRSEPNPVYAANINWLLGYRRKPIGLEKFTDLFEAHLTSKTTISEVLKFAEPEALSRPVLFHLLWLKKIHFNPSIILDDSSEIWRSHGHE